MLTNYFKIAYRNLRKQPGFAAINVFGLALGITCTMLISLWVIDELSFDGFHENADRIYRFNAEIKFGGADMSIACAPAPLVQAILQDYPQIEAACRFRNMGGLAVQHEQESFSENEALFADAMVFDVFSFPLQEGNPKTALSEPNTVVISEKIAHKYFGSQSPIGASLFFDKEWRCRVTGIMQDIPENSHIKADFLLSMGTLEESKEDNWLSNNFNSYLLFRKDYNPEQFQAEWPKVVQRYVVPMGEKVLGTSWSEIEKSGTKVQYGMMPLKDIHLHGGNRLGDISPNGSADTVRVFGIIAFFILLLAAVNFMNLSTARSAQRAREVGVRKVMGSPKSQLIGQFLSESVLLSIMAGIPAILAVWLLLPAFNQLAGKQISLQLLQRPELLLGTALFVVGTGLLAGLYPAFVLSSFKPIKVLKGGAVNNGKSGGARLRNGLVTFQFAISMLLIVGAMVTYQQMNFIQNKNLGFDRSQVLVLKDGFMLGEKAKVLKEQVLQLPGVQSGTIAGFLPTVSNHNDSGYFKDRNFNPDNAISLNDWRVDADYFKTMKIEVLQGRSFDPLAPADSNAVVINQAGAKLLGFPDPLDKELFTFQNSELTGVESYKIIGVVEDFHFESLRAEIAPLLLHRGNNPSMISFRLGTNDYASTIAKIKDIWQKTAPAQPFNYEFMDEQFDQMYRSERRAGTLAMLFAGLAIIIACLGLFGLAAFTAEQRTKEIGIRKVLGASISSITSLLTRDFLKLVLIATIIASPLAYYFMKKWLADFAYHIDLQWWLFAVAGLGAIVIAFMTVSFQSIKAALSNPVRSLRNE